MEQNDFVINEYTVFKYCVLHHYLNFKLFSFGVNGHDILIQWHVYVIYEQINLFLLKIDQVK